MIGVECMTTEKYFEITKKVASNSDFDSVHIGCIAVYKGNIIAKGYNSEKTHPMQRYYNKYRVLYGNPSNMLPKVHAEMKCISLIKGMNIDFKKVKLYIYRIRYDMPFSMARPCPACMKAIMDLGIKDIYYTTENGYAHERLV